MFNTPANKMVLSKTCNEIITKSQVLMGSDDKFIDLPTEMSKFNCNHRIEKSKGTYKCNTMKISFSIIL